MGSARWGHVDRLLDAATARSIMDRRDPLSLWTPQVQQPAGTYFPLGPLRPPVATKLTQSPWFLNLSKE